MKETFYILHKSGADSHYIGLKHLLNTKNIDLKYREFSVFSKMIKAITKLSPYQFSKQLTNLTFLISLLFSKEKKIVLGIAPYDNKLPILLYLLKEHKVYYHTSWTHWDDIKYPKRKKVTTKLLSQWKLFLEEKVTHHFVVTTTTKNRLLKNYQIEGNKISVVNHSVDESFNILEKAPIKLPFSFIYIGRLVPEKGILETIELLKNLEEATFTIVGDGPLKAKIQEAISSCNNIIFKEYIKDKRKLSELLSTHQFLLSNSIRTQKWEELFGMTIIEAMAHGTIPVASDHPGPIEIIHSDFGFIFPEGELIDVINKLSSNKYDLNLMSTKALEASQQYLPNQIAKKWEMIL